MANRPIPGPPPPGYSGDFYVDVLPKSGDGELLGWNVTPTPAMHRACKYALDITHDSKIYRAGVRTDDELYAIGDVGSEFPTFLGYPRGGGALVLPSDGLRLHDRGAEGLMTRFFFYRAPGFSAPEGFPYTAEFDALVKELASGTRGFPAFFQSQEALIKFNKANQVAAGRHDGRFSSDLDTFLGSLNISLRDCSLPASLLVFLNTYRMWERYFKNPLPVTAPQTVSAAQGAWTQASKCFPHPLTPHHCHHAPTLQCPTDRQLLGDLQEARGRAVRQALPTLPWQP